MSIKLNVRQFNFVQVKKPKYKYRKPSSVRPLSLMDSIKPALQNQTEIPMPHATRAKIWLTS